MQTLDIGLKVLPDQVEPQIDSDPSPSAGPSTESSMPAPGQSKRKREDGSPPVAASTAPGGQTTGYTHPFQLRPKRPVIRVSRVRPLLVPVNIC